MTVGAPARDWWAVVFCTVMWRLVHWPLMGGLLITIDTGRRGLSGWVLGVPIHSFDMTA